ncbi:hypothetical protein ACMHYO_11950 [Allopusillimonas ginsengisoli]|uniref:hypothetical protein n=1 Tax=Allopusillimonas ginsengisoli TaxID=453575 RepID=UPI0039C447DA
MLEMDTQLSFLEPQAVSEVPAEPGYVRCLRINEESPELERMHLRSAQQHAQNREPTRLNETQAVYDTMACRGLIASIINLAYTDIECALGSPNPREVRIYHRNRVKIKHNYAFDSAVQFFFGMEVISRTDEMMNVNWANFSSLNAYCSMLGWSAARIRARLLDLFPQLVEHIEDILQDKWLRAPLR